MGNIVLHPTYAERLWLITASTDTGVLCDEASPMLVVQCRRAGWVESASDPGTWRLTAAGWRVRDRLLGPD